MVKINNRLKHLKYKPFRRLRADIWGSIALKNKKNSITKKLKTYLEQDFKYKIKAFTKKQKTAAYKKLDKRSKIKKKKPRFNRFQFDFNIVTKAQEKRRKRVSYRGNLLNEKRRFLVFFGERLRRKQLRKLALKKVKRTRYLERRFLISFPSTKSFGSVFGSRLDLVLFRSQFCTTMRQSRQLIKHKKVMVQQNNYNFIVQKNLGFMIPLFTPIKLLTFLQKKRKIELRHLLLKNLIYYAMPKDLYIDYISMISFRIFDTNSQKFPFGGNLSFFAGLAKFF